jgi:hypothetical protein
LCGIKKILKIKHLLYILILLIGLPASGQNSFSVKQLQEARVLRVKQHYERSKVAHILTGKHYTLRRLHAINSQLFNEMNPLPGTLIYDGVTLQDIVMQYDVASQQIIVLLETGRSEKYVSLDTEKVTGFSIMGYNFSNLPGDSVMAQGIYEIAYSGWKSVVFIKRNKTTTTTIQFGQIIHEYLPSDKYFLRNQFGVFQISNKKSFLEANQFDAEVKALIKKRKIKFSKNKIEQGLLSAVSLLDAEFRIE